MNQLLFDRSTGNLSPHAFARLHTTKLLYSFRSASRFRFDGGERVVASSSSTAVPAVGPSGHPGDAGNAGISIWAHQTGVNALALERFDGRMQVNISLQSQHGN